MNAVVVSYERLSLGFLGAYGNTDVATPHFDRLASESIVFDQHFSSNFSPLATPDLSTTLKQNGVAVDVLQAETGDEEIWRDAAARVNAWDAAARQLLWISCPGPRMRPDGDLDDAIDDYADQIEKCDHDLGRFLSQLNSSALPLIIVTAAAGEIVLTRDDAWGDECSLREEHVHCPLLVRVPDSDQAGSRRQALTQSVDLPPTLAAWFAIDDAPVTDEGHSLWPLIEGRETDVRDYAYLGDGDSHGIRNREFYLVRSQTGALRLFLKPEDRYEQADAAAQYPDVVDRLEAALDEFLARFSKSR